MYTVMECVNGLFTAAGFSALQKQKLLFKGLHPGIEALP